MYKLRFKDIVYLKLNKSRAKISKKKTINIKNIWDVLKLIRNQEITFFFPLPRDQSRENNELIIDWHRKQQNLQIIQRSERKKDKLC